MPATLDIFKRRVAVQSDYSGAVQCDHFKFQGRQYLKLMSRQRKMPPKVAHVRNLACLDCFLLNLSVLGFHVSGTLSIIKYIQRKNTHTDTRTHTTKKLDTTSVVENTTLINI